MAATIPAVGQNRVRPSEDFKLSAQVTSSSPASNKASHAVTIVYRFERVLTAPGTNVLSPVDPDKITSLSDSARRTLARKDKTPMTRGLIAP